MGPDSLAKLWAHLHSQDLVPHIHCNVGAVTGLVNSTGVLSAVYHLQERCRRMTYISVTVCLLGLIGFMKIRMKLEPY